MSIFDQVALTLYGMTRQDALTDGICIKCKNDITYDQAEGHWSYQDTREYFQSALCPTCFDQTCDEIGGECE